ncbi:hypothetical protein ACFX58_15050 [Sphingomonas sp. NCPPB 2930]
MSIGFDAQSIWSCHGRAMTQELRQHAVRRSIGWFEAASQVRLARMLTFRSEQECIRANGRGPSTALEPQRQTFGSLVIEAATQLFGRHADFSALTEAQQNRVYAEIIVAAACSNQQAMSAMRDFTEAGRKFVIVGQAISVYRLAVGADKMRDFGNSGARGSVAGHVFDTPIDVPTVAFISGALAELGSGMGRFIPRANGGGGGGSSSVDMIPKDGYAPAPPRQMSPEGFRGRVADALDSFQTSEFGKIAQGWPVEGVAVGGIKKLAGLGSAEVNGAKITAAKASLLEAEAAKVSPVTQRAMAEEILTDSKEIRLSASVKEKYAVTRPYITPLSVRETIAGGLRTPDPQGIPGRFMYTIDAVYNKSIGKFEVLVNELNSTVEHALFRSDK